MGCSLGYALWVGCLRLVSRLGGGVERVSLMVRGTTYRERINKWRDPNAETPPATARCIRSDVTMLCIYLLISAVMRTLLVCVCNDAMSLSVIDEVAVSGWKYGMRECC